MFGHACSKRAWGPGFLGLRIQGLGTIKTQPPQKTGVGLENRVKEWAFRTEVLGIICPGATIQVHVGLFSFSFLQSH